MACSIQSKLSHDHNVSKNPSSPHIIIYLSCVSFSPSLQNSGETAEKYLIWHHLQKGCEGRSGNTVRVFNKTNSMKVLGVLGLSLFSLHRLAHEQRGYCELSWHR